MEISSVCLFSGAVFLCSSETDKDSDLEIDLDRDVDLDLDLDFPDFV